MEGRKKGIRKVLWLVMASLVVVLASSGVVVAGEGYMCNNVLGTEVDVAIGTEANCLAIGGSWTGNPSTLSTQDCCVPRVGCPTDVGCICAITGTEADCLAIGGMPVDVCHLYEHTPCDGFHCDGGRCVPEIATMGLFAAGLIGLVGYFRLRRKEE